MVLTPLMTWTLLGGITAAVGTVLWLLIAAEDRLTTRFDRLPLPAYAHPTFMDAEDSDLLDGWDQEVSA